MATERSYRRESASRTWNTSLNLLLPKDPNDDKNIILEIRAGAGGDEGGPVAAEVYRMYTNFADSHRWKVEIISLNENGIGGFRGSGGYGDRRGAYSKLKYERRAPGTACAGDRSPAAVSTPPQLVAVMPEAEEVDVQIDMNDCRIDVMRASGTADSALTPRTPRCA